MSLKGKTSGNGQMDRILMALKKKLIQGVSLTLPWGYIHVYEHYIKCIGIYLRSHVSVYKTIGPLVIKIL